MDDIKKVLFFDNNLYFSESEICILYKRQPTILNREIFNKYKKKVLLFNTLNCFLLSE